MTKLCARGIAAAKRKYKVYPSAYANGYAVQVCKGMMPDNSGRKKTASGFTKVKLTDLRFFICPPLPVPFYGLG